MNEERFLLFMMFLIVIEGAFLVFAVGKLGVYLHNTLHDMSDDLQYELRNINNTLGDGR